MKKGFTLIELLAVIIILAIIALIATPIIINIINDTKKSSSIRSAEFYISAIENAIATHVLDNTKIEDGVYPVMENGNICIGSITDNNCDKSVLEVKVTGETPKGGIVKIKDGKITKIEFEFDNDVVSTSSTGDLINGYQKICEGVTEENVSYYMNDNNEKVNIGKIPNGEYNFGDEYICYVNDEKSFNFFILSVDKYTVNLIMDSNINSDGIAIKSNDITNKGNISWVTKKDYSNNDLYGTNGRNDKGPITVINYLNTATSDWTNIDVIDELYDDANGHYKDFPLIGRARLPYRSEIQKKDGTNLWLYNYLVDYQVPYIGRTAISTGWGYFTMDTYSKSETKVYQAAHHGELYIDHVTAVYGVRPVITISKNNIK